MMPHPVKPKLAYVVCTLNPGGTERLVVDMSRAYSSDMEVSVFCLDQPGTWADGLRRMGVPVYCLWRQPGLDLSITLRLARAFRKHGTDIVHAHQCTPWFYAALARIFCRGPRLILEEHGRFYPEVDKRLRRFVNRAIIAPLTHRFIAVSADIRERLVRFEGLRRERIDVIYNGIDSTATIDAGARAALRRELGFQDEDFVVGTVGRLDPIKNLPMLVKALLRAGAEASQLRGLIVGDGPLYGEIETLLLENDARQWIRMTGYRPDARRYVQCMDLFVLASYSEGTSMALLEAMAEGVPAVVTAVGGNPEIVENGREGWVIPSADEERLLESIRSAMEHRGLSRERGRAAREKVLQQFSFDGMIDRYLDVYRSLLTGRRDIRMPQSAAGGR